MNEREIIIVPPTKERNTQVQKNRLMRVASYSRVSTNFEDQLVSFHAQKSYYTDLILRTPGWKLAGTYADEGISGVTAEKRPDFMRLMKHCENGKIDLIITKSMSRFSRNILDTIGYSRKLKAKGIGIYFEKENLNSLEENSEFVMTILASIAQEESNSLSLNVKMGKRMAMKEGRVQWNYANMYGYRKSADGLPEVIAEHAPVVKRIFQRYLAGESDRAIADGLNRDRIPTGKEGAQWLASTVQRILQNERYCGDVTLQKTYIADHISKKVKINNGELPKIYIKNNHTPIVERELYERAMEERARRKGKKKISKNSTTEQGKYSSLYALSDILICGDCGSPYRRVTWTKRSGDTFPVWRCVKRIDHGKAYCGNSVTVDEESLHEAIVKAIAAQAGKRDNTVEFVLKEVEETLCQKREDAVDVAEIEAKVSRLQADIMDIVVKGQTAENLDRMKAMNEEAVALQKTLDEHKRRGGRDATTHQRMEEVERFLKEGVDCAGQYEDALVRQIIHTIKVVDESTILVCFKNGDEYTQGMALRVRGNNRKMAQMFHVIKNHDS